MFDYLEPVTVKRTLGHETGPFMLFQRLRGGGGADYVILKMCAAKFCVFFTAHIFIWIIRMDPKRLFVPVGAVQRLARCGLFLHL